MTKILILRSTKPRGKRITLALKLAISRCRKLFKQLLAPHRPVSKFSATIGAALIHSVAAIRAKGAFKRTDKRTVLIRRQIDAAFLAIGPHV
jgi:hypothetical protein